MDVLAKYKHEANGHLDYTGTGVNRHACEGRGHDDDDHNHHHHGHD